MKIKIKCEVCRKEFERYECHLNKHNFCSRECYNQFHKIKNKIRKCKGCNNFFEASESRNLYCSRECYDKNRDMPKKEAHWNWQGGVSLEKGTRDSNEYKKWREAVYKKDNYTCRQCNKKVPNLNAHHIKSWKEYPELRYIISNGVTLCEQCHINFHKKNGYGKHCRNTKKVN